MSAVDVVDARREEQRRRIELSLRIEWPMIAAVFLRPRREGEGFDAEIRFDPIVIDGSHQQQGYPWTPAALAKAEARRQAALEECVRNVNRRLPERERIATFAVVG